MDMKNSILYGKSMKNTVLLVLMGCMVALAAVSTPNVEKQLDEAEPRLDSLGDYSLSTNKGKDATPVSVSGNVYTRLKNFYYTNPSYLFKGDKARTDMDAAMLVVLGVYPNSYVNLWTTLDIPFDFSGLFGNTYATNVDGDQSTEEMERAPFHHHIDYYGASLWEEMTAGINVRGGSFGGMFKAGGVLWTNASPFSIWDRDPAPRFVSIYETFEEERLVGRLYKEKTFRPVKEGGRAFWTNRPFGGVMLDFYQMPFGLKSQFMLSEPKDADMATRDGLRLYAGQPGDAEMKGTLDFRGTVLHSRVAKEKLFGEMELGLNYVGMRQDEEIISEAEFGSFFGADEVPYYLNVDVATMDLKGNLSKKFMMHVEAAVSIDDSVKYKRQANGTYNFQDVKNASSDPNVALYAKIQDKHWKPITMEALYVPKGFYSPYAMTTDSRNLAFRKQEMYLNAGTYRYSHNLMGANIKFEPEFNRGRFDVFYGLHKQVEPVPDVVLFEHRLNGRMEWETLHSWSKYNSTLDIDQGSVAGEPKGDDKYIGRASLEQHSDGRRHYKQDGGLRGGTWETWEEFVPWESAEDINSGNIPQNEKWSNSLTIDMAYDIAHWFDFNRNMLLHAYTTVSSITTSLQPLPYSTSYDDGVLLWSWYVHSEPAIALTDNFHMIGIFGFEMWKGEQAYAESNPFVLSGAQKTDQNIRTLETPNYTHKPIDYLQTALGFGFDWDFVPRAGLHFRYKYATHEDKYEENNNWQGHYVSAETKAWF